MNEQLNTEDIIKKLKSNIENNPNINNKTYKDYLKKSVELFNKVSISYEEIISYEGIISLRPTESEEANIHTTKLNNFTIVNRIENIENIKNFYDYNEQSTDIDMDIYLFNIKKRPINEKIVSTCVFFPQELLKKKLL